MSITPRKSRRLGKYQVLDRVAAGGMAEVFRARSIEADGSEKVVALKKVLEQYARDPGFIRMLKYEYRLASLLRHPNIAVIHELIRTPDGYYIVMEYVDGRDLRATQHKLWEQKKKWDIADAVYLVARALDGLFHAHTATTEDGRPLNLVHRDFSPSNILIGFDGGVKLIDFGIAKAAMPRDQTAAGIIKGKVRYMSPEQANGDDRLTAQSDVFSAGTVLYELLAGEPAFVAPNELEMIYTVRRAQPRPLREVAPQVPDGLAEIVRRAMARGRKARFGNAAEFRDQLVTFLRAYAPGYRRTRLATVMKSVWQSEIEQEIRTLLEYATGEDEVEEAEYLLETASIDESLDAVSAFTDARQLVNDAQEGTDDFDEQPATVPGRKPSGSHPSTEGPPRSASTSSPAQKAPPRAAPMAPSTPPAPKAPDAFGAQPIKPIAPQPAARPPATPVIPKAPLVPSTPSAAPSSGPTVPRPKPKPASAGAPSFSTIPPPAGVGPKGPSDPDRDPS
ncbi:MAG: protein kinase [Myxococcales bacterium]|nr:protein kinase [Myxococcales bacterium]